VNYNEIDKFLEELDAEAFNATSSYVQQFPLKFDSVDDEVDFIALMDVLQFGSGFRTALHKLCGRGANDTITYGMLILKISGQKLTADYLSSLTITDIRDFFNIPLDVDKEVQPGIKMSVASALRPLAEFITRVLNDIGRILRSRMMTSISQFITAAIGTTSPPSASQLVQQLAAAFPAYNDKATYQGHEVFLLKKAQLTAADLYRKFGSTDPRFAFHDADQMTVFTDNVLPCVLRALNIMELSEALAARIDASKLLQVGDQEVELRAISIAVCDEIVKRAREKYGSKFGPNFTAMKLDYYLWTIGKDEKFRKIPRHYTQETVFY